MKCCKHEKAASHRPASTGLTGLGETPGLTRSNPQFSTGLAGIEDDRCKGAIAEKRRERCEYCGSGDSDPAVGKLASTEAGRHGATGNAIPHED